jgi:histidinol-phosphate phosphatase family protein
MRAEKDNMKKRPAVFLDRDGTLIEERDDIVRPSQVRILKNTAAGLILLRKLGFVLIVITNQPVIGKGLITRKGVERLDLLLGIRLAKKDARIDAFYVCPHRYWDHCPCRKPKIALVRAAAKKYWIDLKRSFFVGDSLRDVAAGKRAKMKAILVKTGKAGRDREFFDAKKIKPDFVARDLLAAAKIISKQQ